MNNIYPLLEYKHNLNYTKLDVPCLDLDPFIAKLVTSTHCDSVSGSLILKFEEQLPLSPAIDLISDLKVQLLSQEKIRVANLCIGVPMFRDRIADRKELIHNRDEIKDKWFIIKRVVPKDNTIKFSNYPFSIPYSYKFAINIVIANQVDFKSRTVQINKIMLNDRIRSSIMNEYKLKELQQSMECYLK